MQSNTFASVVPPLRPPPNDDGAPSTSCTFHLLDITVKQRDSQIVVYLCGVQADGRSVCVEVHYFEPPLYLHVPRHYGVRHVREILARLLKLSHNCRVEMEERWYAFGYQPDKKTLAKVSCDSMADYRRLKYAFSDQSYGDRAPARGHTLRLHRLKPANTDEFRVHMALDRNLPLLFQMETGVTVSSWVQCTHLQPSRTTSSVTRSAKTVIQHVRPVSTQQQQGLAPLVVASFDIEAYSSSGAFPQSHIPSNKIICIGMVFVTYPGEDRRRVCLCLGPVDATDAPKNTYFLSFDTEALLLAGYAELLQHMDPDVVCGYNTYGFDYKFMCDRYERMIFDGWRGVSEQVYDRARAEFHDPDTETHTDARILGVYETYESLLDARSYFSQGRAAEAFGYQHRFDGGDGPCEYKITELTSAAKGQNILHRFDKIGRVDVDMWLYIKDNFKLSSYKLDFVARHFLGGDTGKIALTAKEMFAVYEEDTAAGMRTIADYCLVDCDLPVELMFKLHTLENANEMAIVCSTDMHAIFNRGQQIKAFSLFCREAIAKGYVVNFEDVRRPDEYQGATVLDPIQGFHRQPVATLDFASLYPSIMQANNLCYSTYVFPNEKGRLRSGEYAEFGEHTFVRAETREGILKQILSSLLAQRKIAKKAKKEATDPFTRAIHDGRQLALKIACNSVYGATGVSNGMLPCFPIAESTTRIGREWINQCVDITHARYPDAEVVYGDSVVGHTPLLLRKKGGKIIVRRIDELASSSEWVPIAGGKECCALHGVESWTASGWTVIHRIIRHRVQKALVTVNTTTGIVVCTTDHSLLRPNGEEVSPNHLRKGDQLMVSSFPDTVSSRTRYTWDVWFLRAYVHRPSSTSFSTLKEAVEWSGNSIRWSNEWEWQPQHRHIILNEDMARLLGMFVGDGSCGSYSCQSGKKNSWALNNANRALLDEYVVCATRVFPDFQWRILDTIGSSHVYKLVPQSPNKGAIVNLVRFFRRLCYEPNGEKRIDDSVLNAPMTVREAFWKGLRDADGTKASKYPEISQKGEKICLSIVALLTSIGYTHVTVDARPDKPGVYRMRARKEHRKAPGTIRSITPYAKQELYVYDLTTDNQHFHAGIGNLIVHNTDSVMIKFNFPCSEEGMEQCFREGEVLADVLTEHFAQVTGTTGIVIMEMEKVSWPFLIFKEKKRYVSRYFEDPTKPGKIDAKGVQLVRRDGAPIQRDLYRQIVECIFPLEGAVKNTEDIERDIVQIVRTFLDDITHDRMPIEAYTISKTLRNDYKNGGHNIPHVALYHSVLQRIASGQLTMDPPKSGDRFPYVVIQGPKNSKIYERVECPHLAKTTELDKVYYIQNQLMNAVAQLIEFFSPRVLGLFVEAIAEVQRQQEGTQRITNFFGGGAAKKEGLPPPPKKKQKKSTNSKNDDAPSISSFFGATEARPPPLLKKPLQKEKKKKTDQAPPSIASFFVKKK